MKTALIILNYNNYEDTINCIESVEKYNTASIKYIVVDNGSTRAGVIEKLNGYLSEKFNDDYQLIAENASEPEYMLPYASLLGSQTNDGYARGNNKGLILAYHDNEIDNILILNNDVLFVEDMIPKLIKQQAEIANCGILSPILYKRDMDGIDINCARTEITVMDLIKVNLFHYIYGLFGKSDADILGKRCILKTSDIPSEGIIPIDIPPGSCMFVDKNIFEKIGSFDENTFLYYEENILYKKIASIGLVNYLSLDAKCIHLGACSTTKSSNKFVVACNYDSMKYYVHKYSSCSKFMKVLFDVSWHIAKFNLKIQKTIMKK